MLDDPSPVYTLVNEASATFPYTSIDVAAAGMRVALDDGAGVKDGGTVLTDNTLSVDGVAATTLFIGRTQTPVSQPNGYIRQLIYIPRGLTNAQLQAKTA